MQTMREIEKMTATQRQIIIEVLKALKGIERLLQGLLKAAVLFLCLSLSETAIASDCDKVLQKCAENIECILCFSNERSGDFSWFRLPSRACKHIEDFQKSGMKCIDYTQYEPSKMSPVAAYPPYNGDKIFINK